MARIMKLTAALTLAAAVGCALLMHFFDIPVFRTLAITFATVAYHFWIRLLIGGAFGLIMKNKADLRRRWFRTGKAEMELYRLLRVKSWKGRMPTYDAGQFDPRLHSWKEIAQAMCQAELVHETIIVFSFVPVLFSIWFGETGVFIVTSLISALFDAAFAIMQRYNRPRVLRLIKEDI